MTDLNEVLEIAVTALKHWGLPEQQPELIQHRENTVFRVSDSSGEKFALRIHRQGYHTESALKSELDMMAMLADGGLGIPAPMPTNNREYCVEIQSNNSGARMVDLLSWLPGEPLGKTGSPLGLQGKVRQEVFADIGREMARLHNLADNWHPPSGFSRPAWDRDGLVGENPFWGRFWDLEELTGGQRNLLISARDKLRAELQVLTTTEPDYGIIHADLVRENILIGTDGIRFIDFDDSGFGWRMFDIATALLKNNSEPDYVELETALITGYRERRTLTSESLKQLPLFLMARSLTYLGWAKDRRNEPGVASRIPRLIVSAIAECERVL